MDVSSFYLILSVYTRFQIEDNATLSINWTIDVDIASISTFFPFFKDILPSIFTVGLRELLVLEVDIPSGILVYDYYHGKDAFWNGFLDYYSGPRGEEFDAVLDDLKNRFM